MRVLSKLLLVLFVVLSCLSGCESKQEISIEKWLDELAFSTGLTTAKREDSLEVLGEWGLVFDTIDLNSPLEKQHVALFFDQWLNLEDTSVQVIDANESSYSNQIHRVVHSGLLSVDEQLRFYPLHKCTPEQAQDYIDKFVTYINHGNIASAFSYAFDENQNVVEVAPYEFEEDLMQALFHPADQIEKDDIVVWENEETMFIYRVLELVDGVAKLEEIELSEFEDLEFGGEFELDFSDAEFQLNSDMPSVMSVEDTIIFVSSLTKNEFKIGDFTVRYNFTASSLYFYAFTQLEVGGNLFTELQINNVKPSFHWKSQGLNIEHAFFKITYNSTLSGGYKRGTFQQYNLDFSKLDSADLPSSLLNSWSSQRASVDTILPLGQIKIPVTSIPSLYITLDVGIRVFFNGTIELVCNAASEHGFEIKNNTIRVINDVDKDVTLNAHASTGVTGTLKATASMFSMDLMDIRADLGVRAKISTTAYFPETRDEFNIGEVPYDVLIELQGDNHDFTLCGALQAHWLAEINLNTIKTVAGRLNFSRTFSLLNERNAPLFNGSILYIENMQFVDACSRDVEKFTPIPTIDVSVERILLEHYSMVNYVGKSRYIMVRGIPEEFQLSDLRFKSLDETVATVDSNGLVKGISEGNTKIQITLDESEHIVEFHVLVKTE